MRKYSKLIFMMSLMMIITCFSLVACGGSPEEDGNTPSPPPIDGGGDGGDEGGGDTGEMTDAELFNKIVSEHMSMSGYTLNIDSIPKVKEANDFDAANIYIRVDVTVDGSVSTTQIKEKSIPEIGQEDVGEIVKVVKNDDYKGEKLCLNLSLDNFENHEIAKDGDIITVSGNILDANASSVFKGAEGYSNINIKVTVNAATKQVTGFVATFDQSNVKSRMTFNLK